MDVRVRTVRDGTHAVNGALRGKSPTSVVKALVESIMAESRPSMVQGTSASVENRKEGNRKRRNTRDVNGSEGTSTIRRSKASSLGLSFSLPSMWKKAKYFCKHCEEQLPFHNELSFQQHLQRCQQSVWNPSDRHPKLEESVLCSICNSPSPTAYDLTRHLQMDHPEVDEPMFTCSVCNRQYRTAIGLGAHWKNPPIGEVACNGDLIVGIPGPPTLTSFDHQGESVDGGKEEGREVGRMATAKIQSGQKIVMESEDVEVCEVCASTYEKGHKNKLKHYSVHHRDLYDKLRDSQRRRSDSANGAPSGCVEEDLSLGDIPTSSPSPIHQLSSLFSTDFIPSIQSIYCRNMYEPTQCPLCEIPCSSFFAFGFHILQKHHRVPGLFFHCRGCSKSFRGAEGLKAHLVQMEKRNQTRCQEQGCVLSVKESIQAAYIRRRKGDFDPRNPPKMKYRKKKRVKRKLKTGTENEAGGKAEAEEVEDEVEKRVKMEEWTDDVEMRETDETESGNIDDLSMDDAEEHALSLSFLEENECKPSTMNIASDEINVVSKSDAGCECII